MARRCAARCRVLAADDPDPDANRVTLFAEGSKLIVQAGPTRYTLQTLPVEDYPQLPALPPGGGWVDGPALVAAIKRVIISVGRDDTIPMPTSVHITAEGKTLTLAGTDRFRLATAERTWIPDAPDAGSWTALLPAKFLKAVATRWAKTIGDLSLTWQADTDTDTDTETRAEAAAFQALTIWRPNSGDRVVARPSGRRQEARGRRATRQGTYRDRAPSRDRHAVPSGEQHTTRCLHGEFVRYRSYTNHTGADQNSNDNLLMLLAAAGCTFVMGVPAGDDVMLNYQSTSYHDVAGVRQALGLGPAPAFARWYEHAAAQWPTTVAEFADAVGGSSLRALIPGGVG